MKFLLPKLILFLIILIIGIIFFYSQYNKEDTTEKIQVNKNSVTAQNDPPKIVSTKPEPLAEAIISATEIIEITFNRPLQNIGEFKVRIEPEIKYKVELSPDRKSAKIIPLSPYDLGRGYTLYIGAETKFDGVGRWGEDKTYHFRTISYRGV